MKKAFFLLIVFCYGLATVYGKDTSRVGLYLKSIYNIQPNDYTFCVDFYLWVTSHVDSLNITDNIEIFNGKDYEFVYPAKDRDSNLVINYRECKATVINNWDLKNYPFDKQIL